MKRSDILKLRGIIEKSIQSVDDNTALSAVVLHPLWAVNVSYTAGFKIRRNDRLYRCIQAHTSLTGWEPENVASLWEQVNETHSGTIDDPIPYSGNMALENGKHYVQNYEIYRCIRDTVNPVYNSLVELVGLFVEAV
jgi:hypothetical protein